MALDDELFPRFAPRLAALVARGGALGRLVWRLLPRRAQAAASRGHARQRREQMLADERFDQAMGFAGKE